MHSAQSPSISAAVSKLEAIGIKISPSSWSGENFKCPVCWMELEDLKDPLKHFIMMGCCGRVAHFGCDIEAYRSRRTNASPMLPFEEHSYKCNGCNIEHTIEYQMQLRALSTYIATSVFIYLNIINDINSPQMRKLFLLVQQQVILTIINREVELPTDNNNSMDQLKVLCQKTSSFFQASRSFTQKLYSTFYTTAIFSSVESLGVFHRMDTWYREMPVGKKALLNFDRWIKNMLAIKEEAFKDLINFTSGMDYYSIIFNAVFSFSCALILENSLIYMFDNATSSEPTPFNGFRLTPKETAKARDPINTVLKMLGVFDGQPITLMRLDHAIKPITDLLYQEQRQSRADQLYNIALASAPKPEPALRLEGGQAQQLAPPPKGSLDWLPWPVLLGMLAFSIAYLIYEQSTLPPR